MSFFLINQCEKNSYTETQIPDDLTQVDKIDLADTNLSIKIYNHIDIKHTDYCIYKNGTDFLISFGVFIFDSKTGVIALQQYHDHSRTLAHDNIKTHGHYALLAYINKKLSIINDEFGGYKIFHNADYSSISNSFPLILESSTNKLKVNLQSCYEYIYTGAIYGDESVVTSIKTLARSKQISLRDSRSPILESSEKSAQVADEIGFSNPADLLENNTDALSALFDQYDCFRSNGFNVALSGGYDSRLLAALLVSKEFDSSYFVYGKDDDVDVKIAREIAKVMDFKLDVIDKSKRHKDVKVDGFLNKKYWLYGAIPFLGLFGNQYDFADRLNRADDGSVLMNGSGGEIYRHFYYMPDREIKVSQFVKSFFLKYKAAWITSEFNEQQYVDCLVEKINGILKNRDSRMSRAQVDSMYHMLRTRYWSAQDMSNNLNFGKTLYPFLEKTVIDQTHDVSFSMRKYGKFESQLITKLSPELAGINSSYGFSFDTEPGIAYKLKSLSSYYRSHWMRKHLNMIRRSSNARKSQISSLNELCQRSIDNDLKLKKYINAENIDETIFLNRYYSVEYILSRNNIDV